MLLQKGEITYNLTDETQIEAFLGSGWQAQAEEPEPESDKPKNGGRKTQSDEKPRQ